MDEEGRFIDSHSSEYGFHTPEPLWSEQDPSLWRQAAIESIQALLAKSSVSGEQVVGIGLSGQMHGLVLLDKDGNVLRPAILWNDQRTQAQCDQIRDKFGKTEFIALTGNDALTGFTAPKILWVAQHEPEIYSKTAHILLPKDYLRYCLSGEFAMDKAGGSGTVLFDLAKRDWSSKLADAFDVSLDVLPKTFEGTEACAQISEIAAKETSLKAGTPIFAGGGDQAASAVGTGAVEEGIVSVSLGTSGVVFASMDTPSIEADGRLHAFCHALPDKWHLMGVMLSAGGSLRWYRDTFAPEVPYDELLQRIESVTAGSDGLLFLPYLTGERTPHPDPLARGAFVGLTVRHGFDHMLRSVIEGVSFGLKDSLELLKRTGLSDISQVRVTGGGANSAFWRQILADVFNVEVQTVNTSEGAAFGAALLAATGAGLFLSVEQACKTAISVTESTIPSSNALVYDELYPAYQELYPALKPSFHS